MFDNQESSGFGWILVQMNDDKSPKHLFFGEFANGNVHIINPENGLFYWKFEVFGSRYQAELKQDFRKGDSFVELSGGLRTGNTNFTNAICWQKLDMFIMSEHIVT